jgi:hypothetical protein
MVEPNQEIDDLFEIDENDVMAKHVASILDEGINEEDKKNYFNDEVDRFFSEAINHNIEQANIRLESDLMSSVP